MGLFDNEQIPTWFQELFSDLLAAYPEDRKGSRSHQDKKFWWNLKFYRQQAIELGMKRATSRFANFPTPQAIVDLLPDGSRLDRASHEHVETVRSVTLSPKTQAQSRLNREMLAKEKALIGRSVELPWEQYEEERRRYSEWYKDVFWPDYQAAAFLYDPPMTQEEIERGKAYLREWIAKAGKGKEISQPSKKETAEQGEEKEKAYREWKAKTYPKEEPPRTEKTYSEYREGIKDNEIPFG